MQPSRLDLVKEDPALLHSATERVQEYLGWFVDTLKDRASSLGLDIADNKVRAEYIGKIADVFFDDQKYGHACSQYLTSLDKHFNMAVFLGAKNSFRALLRSLELSGGTELFENGQYIELKMIYDRYFAISQRILRLPVCAKDSELHLECILDLLQAALRLIIAHGIYNCDHLKVFLTFQKNGTPNYDDSRKFQLMLADFESRVDILGQKTRGWRSPSFSRFT